MMHRRWTALTAAVVALALLAVIGGCKPQVEQPEPIPQPEPPRVTTPEEEPEATEEESETVQEMKGSVVKIKTQKGDIIVELFDKDAPITAGSFLLLVEAGFYDGVVIHRVDPRFVIQGGDPTGTGEGGPGFAIPLEVKPELKHDRGILSMARTPDPDSAGSQFFICLSGDRPVRNLDTGYAVFGKVVEGMDVVDQIKVGDKMLEVMVEQKSADAEAAKKAAEKARVYE